MCMACIKVGTKCKHDVPIAPHSVLDSILGSFPTPPATLTQKSNVAGWESWVNASQKSSWICCWRTLWSSLFLLKICSQIETSRRWQLKIKTHCCSSNRFVQWASIRNIAEAQHYDGTKWRRITMSDEVVGKIPSSSEQTFGFETWGRKLKSCSGQTGIKRKNLRFKHGTYL